MQHRYNGKSPFDVNDSFNRLCELFNIKVVLLMFFGHPVSILFNRTEKLPIWYQKLQQSPVSMAVVLLPPPHVHLSSAGIQHVQVCSQQSLKNSNNNISAVCGDICGTVPCPDQLCSHPLISHLPLPVPGVGVLGARQRWTDGGCSKGWVRSGELWSPK